MLDRDCEEARERLALGEEDAVAEHLRRCPSCRREAEALRRIVSALGAADFAIEPPASVDAAVRARIAQAPAAPPPVLRPAPAFALALAGLGALVASVAAVFDAAGKEAVSMPLGAGVTVLYLALCAAATVPLLIHGAARSRSGAPEVRR